MRLRRCGQPLAICVLTVLGLLTIAGALSGCESGIRGGSPSVTQEMFETQIRQDRAELMTGVLTYSLAQALSVSTTSALTVSLRSVRGNEPVSAGDQGPFITLKVGGVEGATLTAAQGSVTITRVGPATGLIAQPGDAVGWTWDLSPRRPGHVVLDLVVVTYLGRTSEPLYTLNPPLAIRLTAANTLGYQARSVGSDVSSVAAVVGSVAGAIVAVAGCVAGIMTWRTRRKKRGQQAARPVPDVGDPAEKTGEDRPFAPPD